jgi:Zn-dependent protease/predicted transcriptional regulator
MSSPGIKVFRVLGIPIYLHPSWFIIFALITLSLSTQFANQHPQWTPAQHWSLGVLTSVLFFMSVLLHELSHSVIALYYKIPVVSITLFVFGGLARIGREPSSAKKEFNIAVAGPISSFLISLFFYTLTRVFPESLMMGSLAGWLFKVNFALAAFNLVPGFPLDGGRILRALVWGATGDFTRATRFASRSGQFFAYAMILGGVVISLRGGGFFSGLWLAFIGWFLLTAAQSSYAQVAIHDALIGLHATDVMQTDLPIIAGDISLEEYGHEVLRTGRRCHLVVRDGKLHGLMSVHTLNRIPREEWVASSVQSAMIPGNQIHWAKPEEPAIVLLERMQSEDINQLPVVSEDKVNGMVTRESLLRVIRNRAELGQMNLHR